MTEDIPPAELSELRSTFQTVLKTPQPRGTSGDDAYVFEEDEQEQAEVKALKERLGKLKIVARAKVTQDRVYSAAYHPEPTKDLIFFGGIKSSPTREVTGVDEYFQTNTGNWVYGMPVHQSTKSQMKTTMLRLQKTEKVESTIVCRCIGLQLRSLQYPA